MRLKSRVIIAKMNPEIHRRTPMQARKPLTLTILFALSLALLSATCAREAKRIAYPQTKKVDVVDNYFGTEVPDPYRWLEDDNSEQTKDWVAEQNKLTFSYLERIPFRERIRKRLREVNDYPRIHDVVKAGDYIFFYRNEGLQNQSVIYVQRGLDGKPEVFIDPNLLSPDGTLSIDLAGFSHDYRYVAITRSEAGSDWTEIRVMEIATKKELPDRIRWVKFSNAAWYKDGFFYCGYDKPAPGEELKAPSTFQKVFYHRLGDPQEKDQLIYQDEDHPDRYFEVGVSEDERFAAIAVSPGTWGSEIYWKDLTQPQSEFKLLIPGFDSENQFVDNIDHKFIVRTNRNAPNYRLVLIDGKNPAEENWREIIPEKPQVLTSAVSAGGYIFAFYLEDAHTKVYQYNRDGSLVREVELPALGTAGGFHGRKDDEYVFYTFESFTYPPTIYRYDLSTGKSTLFFKHEVKFEPEDFEVKQVFYPSKDGTMIPMFIVHKRDLVLNGKNPVLLTGYGGFNASLLPSFSPSRIVPLENGFVFARPNLRGGGEYGEEWHRAGMLENKQNVFDDFIAAAEYLIREKYTSPKLIAISGGSNGGLLVAAAMTQRPDLFAVALPSRGVLDMLRYHKFTVGWGWVVEYGSSDNEEQFRYLIKYSPLHNLRKGSCYPATLITTADHDDRVVPAHSFKFAAALQEAQGCSNPVLIRVETRSGHSASSLSKGLDELTDEYSFMFWQLGIKPVYE